MFNKQKYLRHNQRERERDKPFRLQRRPYISSLDLKPLFSKAFHCVCVCVCPIDRPKTNAEYISVRLNIIPPPTVTRLPSLLIPILRPRSSVLFYRTHKKKMKNYRFFHFWMTPFLFFVISVFNFIFSTINSRYKNVICLRRVLLWTLISPTRYYV